jgi:hypothetical protein
MPGANPFQPGLYQAHLEWTDAVNGQEFADDTVGMISFPTAISDTGSMFNLGASATRINCPVKGKYRYSGYIWWRWTASTTGKRQIGIIRSGSLVNAMDTGAYTESSGINQSISGEVICNAGQYLELRGYQNSGAALRLRQAMFSVTLVTPVP